MLGNGDVVVKDVLEGDGRSSRIWGGLGLDEGSD